MKEMKITDGPDTTNPDPETVNEINDFPKLNGFQT